MAYERGLGIPAAGLVLAAFAAFAATTTTAAHATSSESAAAGRQAVPEAPPQEREDTFAKGLRQLDSIQGLLAIHPDSLPLRLDRLRLLFVLGVKQERYLRAGLEETRGLQGPGKAPAGLRPVLLAYEGAFRVVEAKHGFRPGRKWESMQAGIPRLDSAVALSPGQPEVRYLRLVSCYYLPFFMGRKPMVREDFLALGRLLPRSHADYPPRWFLGVADFVLRKGRLPEEDRKLLAARMDGVAREAGLPPPGRGKEP